MKKIVVFISPLLVFSGIVSMGTIFWADPGSAFAMEGSRIGNTWTDAEGNNYEGDPSSGSSSGYQYTYGYTNNSGGSTYSGPTWAERQEANRLRAAAKLQQKAVKINDEGVEYAKKGNFQKALEYYQKAAAIDPSNPTIQNNIRSAQGTVFNDEGIRYYSDGNYQMAAESYRKALELKPDSETIRQNLADAEQQLDYQQEWRAKEAQKKTDMDAAGAKIQGMLNNLSASLESKERSSSLSFKSAEAPKTGNEEGHKIVNREALSFKNMQPKDRSSELTERTPPPPMGSKKVKGQLNSATFHGLDAQTSSGAESVKEKSGYAFDTAGIPGDQLDTSAVTSVPETKAGALTDVMDPVVPEGKRTPAIEKFEAQRGEFRGKRQEIEAKIAAIESSKKPDPVQIVKLRDEATQIKNKENFLSFQISDELAKAPDSAAKDKKNSSK